MKKTVVFRENQVGADVSFGVNETPYADIGLTWFKYVSSVQIWFAHVVLGGIASDPSSYYKDEGSFLYNAQCRKRHSINEEKNMYNVSVKPCALLA